MLYIKRIFIIIATALSVVFFTSCTVRKGVSGPMKSRTVKNAPFHSLEVRGNIQVEYKEGMARQAVVEADEVTLERVRMKVEDGHLTIDVEDNDVICLGKVHPAKVTLSSQCLDQIVLASGGSFKAMSSLYADSLLIELAGNGKVEMDSVICKGIFSAIIDGSGSVQSGPVQASQAVYSIAGSGSMKIAEKGVPSSEFSIAGSGLYEVSLDSCGKVTAEIAGSGIMDFSGRADCLEQEVYGSGKIRTDKLTITSLHQ